MQPNWLAQRSYLTPNRVALSFQNDEWTFKELHLEAISIAEKLATLHLRSGDRVAILSPSRPELIMMIYGCMHAQLEIVFLNGRLSVHELTYQIEDAQVKAILVHEQEQEKLQVDVRLITV